MSCTFNSTWIKNPNSNFECNPLIVFQSIKWNIKLSPELNVNQALDTCHDALGSGSQNTRARATYNVSCLFPSLFDLINLKVNEMSSSDWPWLNSAATHLLIIYSSYTVPSCACVCVHQNTKKDCYCYLLALPAPRIKTCVSVCPDWRK